MQSVKTKLDVNGRVMLRKTIRKKLNIGEREALVFYTDGDDRIALKKSLPKCIFCGSTTGIIEKNYKLFCTECKKRIAEIYKQIEDQNESK